MNEKNTLYIVIPCYKEEAVLPETSKRLREKMNALRAAPPAEIGGETVTGCLDYDREGTGLPRSNVLRFLLEQGEAVIRPSGTEPKLKVYLTYWGENGDTMEKLCAHFDAWAR